jgi:hypothetical protein
VKTRRECQGAPETPEEPENNKRKPVAESTTYFIHLIVQANLLPRLGACSKGRL